MALLMIGIIVILIIVFVVLGIKKVISKKQVVGFSIFSTVVVIALSFLFFFIISSCHIPINDVTVQPLAKIDENWKIKVTYVDIDSINVINKRYIYENNKCIAQMPVVKDIELGDDINLEEIIKYIKEYESNEQYSKYYCIELDDGTIKHVDRNDEYLQEFFGKIALNRAIY